MSLQGVAVQSGDNAAFLRYGKGGADPSWGQLCWKHNENKTFAAGPVLLYTMDSAPERAHPARAWPGCLR